MAKDLLITKRMEEKEIEKISEEVKEREEQQNFKPECSFDTAEKRMWMGERPQYKRTQQELDELQILTANSVQLMYNRLIGKLEPRISLNQYNQFLVDMKEEAKLYAWGFITKDDIAIWTTDAINVEDETNYDEETEN